MIPALSLITVGASDASGEASVAASPVSILIFLGLSALAVFVSFLLFYWMPRHALSPRGLSVAGWIFRAGLAAVFILAAVPKLIDPYGFAVNVFAYRAVSPFLATLTAVVLPPIELVAALALVSGLFWRGAAVATAGMLIIFIVMLFRAIVLGIDITCGCFGKASHEVSFWLIAQDYGLLILALSALSWDWRRKLARQAAATA